jgi:hypothetical protein
MIYLLLLLCAALGILGLTYALYGILRTWRQLERRIAPVARKTRHRCD